MDESLLVGVILEVDEVQGVFLAVGGYVFGHCLIKVVFFEVVMF